MIGLLVLVSACKKETTPVAATQSGSKILVTGQDAGAGLKSTLNGLATLWKGSDNYSVSPNVPDRVGIYSTQARTATSRGGTAIVNTQFTAGYSTASSTFSGTMYWGEASVSHHFYAYYPYTAGSAASTVVPVSLASAQTQSATNNSDHIGALDFMVATPVTVNSPANTDAVGNAVNLRYNHLFTILEFQIKGTGSLKAVSLSASNTLAFSGGTIDIAQPTPATDAPYIATKTGTTTQATVTLTSLATLNVSTAATVSMVINPGTPTGDCLVGLSSDGTNWTYISKIAPVGGFLRGKKYVVAIDQATAFGTVTSNSKIWMDRNLGATRVALSSTDAAAYGDLYQWGRGTDGHQIITSTTTSTLSSGDAPGNAYFITTASSPYDWLNPQNVNLWQGLTGINNPCPSGFRIPTSAELEAERASWGSNNNAAGAFGSPLKLPVAGYRDSSNGSFGFGGSLGHYWSSTVNDAKSSNLLFYNNNASMNSMYHAYGYSVRCIKN
ncbi:MAG: fimbrillin family protein [Prolixibacteraceae bacterium]